MKNLIFSKDILSESISAAYVDLHGHMLIINRHLIIFIVDIITSGCLVKVGNNIELDTVGS